MDKYPILPVYLARRLASANHARAERLRQKRPQAETPVQYTRKLNPSFPAPTTKKPRRHIGARRHISATCNRSYTRLEHLKVHERTHKKENPKPITCPMCTICFSRRDEFVRHLLKFHPLPTDLQQRPRRESKSSRALADSDAAPFENFGLMDPDLLCSSREPTLAQSSASDFWTGGRSNDGAKSVHSRSSSRNSSLHGRPKFDPQDQNPTYLSDDQRRSSNSFSSESRGLRVPPIELGKQSHFRCDICGQTVWVNRRLEWQ